MLINDVCKECKLTRKAVEYYEKQDLIHPDTGENSYRIYNERDVSVLKEISVLRRLNISVADIKNIILSDDKPAILAECKHRIELEMQKKAQHIDCMERLINDYNIERAMTYTEDTIEANSSIREKLVRAFPGTYGMYLCVHFGQFLNETIDTPEKQIAYGNIIDFLDKIESIEFSPELKELFEQSFQALQKSDLEKMDKTMLAAIDNIDSYMENSQNSIEEYLTFRNSEEFRESAAYKAQQLLLQFQQTSGYYDVFIPNLKILSHSYQKYVEKLEEANTAFIDRYPEAKDISKI